MIQNKNYSKSFSKRKSSYAPIMLTSKTVKPLYRQDKNPSNNTENRQSLHFRVNMTRSMKQSHQEIINQNQQNDQKFDRLNFTQNNFNRINHQELGRTFSYKNKKNKFLQSKDPQIIANQDKQLCNGKILNQGQENVFENNKNNQQSFEHFSMKQPAVSAVVKMEFNQQHFKQKAKRKNNSNNTRYHVLFSNSHVLTRPICRSVPHTTKNTAYQQVKQIDQLLDTYEENPIKQSSSLRKNLSISTNKPIETYFWLKDPSRKFMFSQKQKPFDLTFSNFKQKIYEKKVNRSSNNKTRYNQEWNDYLNKYYLNIKKVRPLLKCDSSKIDQTEQVQKQKGLQQEENANKNDSSFNNKVKRESKSSAEVFLNQIKKTKRQENLRNQIKFNNMNQTDDLQQNVETRIRSNTIMTSSKTTSILQNKNKKQLSPQKNFKNPDLSKIQLDILTKRISINRKDHFVFGMGDASKQSKNQNPNLIKFNLYKDFLWKVNFTNLIHVRMPDDIEKPYKFFVGKGNNSALIKGIMRRRFWWQIVDKISPQINFVWTQLRVNQFVKSQKKRKNQQLKIVLHQNFSNHQRSQILTQYLPQQLQQSFSLNKKIFKGNDLRLWLQHFKINSKHQQKYVQQVNFNILQKRMKSMVRKKILTFLDSSQTSQQKTHNHFESNFYIGNKKALFYAMRKYYKLYGLDPFDFIPLTFHISGGLQDPEFNEFLDKYNMINQERMKNKKNDARNIWIVKPGQITNRGRGITVCATLDQIKIRLKSKQKNSDGSLRTYILQKYIQKPLLYQKRKFDIRHYMLMTCINGCIKGYWYQQGYIRTTSTEYNIKNCKDLYTHLTNDAIQKNSAGYGKFQKGNKISYEDFQKYMVKNHKKDFDFSDQILPQMKRLATDAIRATYSIIQPHRRQNNFELFGLDFMLDENMKVYLIECNTNPCLQLSCPLLSNIISGLIENVFKICIDPIFPPPFEWPNSKKFQLGEDALSDMKFEIVFDELCDGKQLEKLYGNEIGFGEKMGKVQQDDEEYQEDEDDKEWNEESNS